MRISEIFRFVLINIRQNKSKVFLTSLGIIVGTATIVMVIAIGEGGKADVAEQFKTLNAGTITVSATSSFSMPGGMDRNSMKSGAGGMRPSAGSSSSGGMSSAAMSAMFAQNTLQESQLEEVLFFVPDIVTGAISASSSNSILGGYLEDSMEVTIIGTQSSYQQISNLELLMGTFITEEELENVKRAVVLGYDIAISIFGSPYEAYNQKVEIDGRTYIVNGVLSQMGSVVSGIAPDTSVFMPYSTAEKYIFERNFTPQFSILARDVGVVESVIQNIQLVLQQSNPDSQYTITDAGATMEAAMQSANTLSMLLMAVAVIVFVVGGIGIMNVLFVSVKERTREIGVLRAIGTRKKDILLLFLVEAGMIGLLGGMAGIGLSFIILPLMQQTEITVVVTASSVMIAFTFAVVTATIFGFYPAKKAAGLIPIEALNN